MNTTENAARSKLLAESGWREDIEGLDADAWWKLRCDSLARLDREFMNTEASILRIVLDLQESARTMEQVRAHPLTVLALVKTVCPHFDGDDAALMELWTEHYEVMMSALEKSPERDGIFAIERTYATEAWDAFVNQLVFTLRARETQRLAQEAKETQELALREALRSGADHVVSADIVECTDVFVETLVAETAEERLRRGLGGVDERMLLFRGLPDEEARLAVFTDIVDAFVFSHPSALEEWLAAALRERVVPFEHRYLTLVRLLLHNTFVEEELLDAWVRIMEEWIDQWADLEHKVSMMVVLKHTSELYALLDAHTELRDRIAATLDRYTQVLPVVHVMRMMRYTYDARPLHLHLMHILFFECAILSTDQRLHVFTHWASVDCESAPWSECEALVAQEPFYKPHYLDAVHKFHPNQELRASAFRTLVYGQNAASFADHSENAHMVDYSITRWVARHPPSEMDEKEILGWFDIPTENTDKLEYTLERILYDGTHIEPNITLEICLRSVIAFAESQVEETRDAIRARLIEEMNDSYNTCQSGYVMRILNSVNGFSDDLVSIDALVHEMRFAAMRYLQTLVLEGADEGDAKMLEILNDESLRISGAVADRSALVQWTGLVARHMTALRAHVFAFYPDLLTDAFEEYWARALESIMMMVA